MIIQRIIANPYACSILLDSSKCKTIPTQPINNNQFIDGIYNCPLSSVGYFIFTLGQKLRRMASLINVKEPLISACDAITAAKVAITIPMG